MPEEFNAYQSTAHPSKPKPRRRFWPESKLLGCLLLVLGGLLSLIFFSGGLLFTVPLVKKAARQTDSSNQMRILTRAMLEYEATHQHLPQHDHNGLSWRVHLLPFIEMEELHSRFHLDEPWDSPHNIQLLDEMPSVFDTPILDEPWGCTVYQVPYTDTATQTDPKELALFDNSGKAIASKDIPDGAAQTIMLLEVDSHAAVQWTKPADWKFSPAVPRQNLGKLRSGPIAVGFADGTCQAIPSNASPEQFKALISRDGGEQPK